MPNLPHQDGPLARVGAYDLTTAAGLALLRRFDAQFHRLPSGMREEAVRGLDLLLPLADRAEGILVLPGGALARRDGEAVFICDPASAVGLTAGAVALRDLVRRLPEAITIQHDAAGLRHSGEGPCPPQTATLLPRAAALSAAVPAVAEWRGAAMIHWYAGGAVMWEMVPAPPSLALAVSLTGEALEPGSVLPRFLWAMTGPDERYQHLSSGLFAHLDDVLANEVSDTLRFALVARWTDGDDSVASRLADGLGLLPTAFGAEAAHPAGLSPLAAWARIAAGLAPGQVLFGIAAEAQERWDAALRRGFLDAARKALPPTAMWAAETEAGGPVPLHGLAADRMARADAPACGALFPLEEAEPPHSLLRRALMLARSAGTPLLVAVPALGLCHWVGASGPGAGNGAAYGLGAAIDLFEED
ncbi:MAG: hypothetical protein JWP20_1305 [Roseomonas sp.]|nr:hypothetical protein [Roseomonas sp.]